MKNLDKLTPEQIEKLKIKAFIFDKITDLIEDQYLGYLMKLTIKEKNIPLKKAKKLLKQIEIFFKPTFFKDFKKLPKRIKVEVRKICFEIFPKINSINEISLDIKQLKGYRNFYRTRLGEYRIGFMKNNKKIIFMRVKHRKDIYREFP